ncbi:hypothetical protein BSKO_11520 [Bryopsis sp. KO-2023]|nr:hypothetical protein BSKO_11520 [Bryopsis sp. KO-2023]
MSLPKHQLGNTGLEVSVLSYGASALGAVFDENMDVEEGIASVHEALKLGINLFDTSPFYGITKSETVLGRALASVPRSEYILSSKCGRYGEDTFDFSAERVTSSIQESLDRLGVEHIDLIHCHDMEFVNLDQIVNETLPALKKLKEKGVIRFIGISGLPLKIFRNVLDKVEPGSVDVILTYCHSTLFDNALAEFIPYLESKGVGVINAAALSMGLLSPQGAPSWHPASQDVKDACQKAASICKAAGVSLPKLAIKHSISCPGIATTLLSMPTRAQVRENVNGVLEAFDLVPVNTDLKAKQDACLAEIKQLFAPVMNSTWSSGLPENN